MIQSVDPALHVEAYSEHLSKQISQKLVALSVENEHQVTAVEKCDCAVREVYLVNVAYHFARLTWTSFPIASCKRALNVNCP